jgi:hypothetical protein
VRASCHAAESPEIPEPITAIFIVLISRMNKKAVTPIGENTGWGKIAPTCHQHGLGGITAKTVSDDAHAHH